MNKIKDILYDTNDILIALLILLLATFVVFTRVNAIMDYPERALAAENSDGYTQVSDAQSPSLPVEEDGQTTGEDGQTIGEDGQTTEDHGQPDDQGENQGDELYSLYIAPGQPMANVARNLVELGFFENDEAFFTALEERGVSTKVQAGNFIIPADATTDELIGIITKPGL